MYALLETNEGEDNVSVSTNRSRLESIAIENIQNHIETWDGFPKDDECFKLLDASLKGRDIDLAMDLFSEMTSILGNCIWMRIVPIQLEFDA